MTLIHLANIDDMWNTVKQSGNHQRTEDEMKGRSELWHSGTIF